MVVGLPTRSRQIRSLGELVKRPGSESLIVAKSLVDSSARLHHAAGVPIPPYCSLGIAIAGGVYPVGLSVQEGVVPAVPSPTAIDSTG